MRLSSWLLPALMSSCGYSIVGNLERRLLKLFSGLPPVAADTGFILLFEDDERCRFLWRHSTIEVHPKISEAPHLRSSTSRENRLLAKSSCLPMTNPMAQVPKTSFFETRLAFQRFWVKERRHSEDGLVEICYLYRRTRLCHHE